MTPYYADDLVTLHHGDCLDALRALPDASVDSVVTDPPYGLGFMGKQWDSAAALNSRGKGPKATAFDGPAFHAWCTEWTAECLRVLKPGGHLLAFGGTRTWHRLACAIEDAGFEIRDSIAWLYGSGFPKSLDVSKAIDKAAGATREVVGVAKGVGSQDTASLGPYAPTYDATAPATPDAEKWQGWGTALKPAFEPVVVGRKPLTGTVAANVLAWGTGALNIDACRVGPASDKTKAPTSRGDSASWFTTSDATNLGGDDTRGRWPANVALDQSQAAELDQQSGITTSGSGSGSGSGGIWSPSTGKPAGPQHGDIGGASRFFPTFRYEAKAPTVERPRADEVAHPTVKPLDLMRWLVRLVTPPGGTVLEPFAGSGTTAEACVIEGFQCIAIEREADYLPLIVARLSKPIQPDIFGGMGA